MIFNKIINYTLDINRDGSETAYKSDDINCYNDENSQGRNKQKNPTHTND